MASPTKSSMPSGTRMEFGIRHLMLATVLAAILLIVGMQFWQLLLVFALTVAPLVLVIGVVVYLLKRKASQQDAMLAVMAIAAERGMPLGPGVAAFADLCSGGTRRRALGLAYLLESGTPLPRALTLVRGLLPRQAAVLAAVGWEQGALASGLREGLDAQATRRAQRAQFLPKLTYLCVLLVTMQAIGGFIALFIAPKFQMIFADFGVALPALTQFVFRSSYRIGQFILPLGLLELALLIYIPYAYFGFVRWEPPLVGRLLRRRDTATVLRALAIGVRASRPLLKVLGQLEQVYPRRWVRGRLAHARVRVENGTPWTRALFEQGLLRREDAAVLESAERAGNLVWALDTMADANDRRLGYRLEVLSQLVFPLTILAVGAVVLLLATGYFLPLIQLVRSLAS